MIYFQAESMVLHRLHVTTNAVRRNDWGWVPSVFEGLITLSLRQMFDPIRAKFLH